jgi:hypothetical protein
LSTVNANLAGGANLTSGQERMPANTRASIRSRIANWYFFPAFAPIIQNRWLLLILAGLGIFQVGLVDAGWWGWQCPIEAIFGIPCPGCGLTRSMVLLIHGEWQAAVATHAFAPLFLATLILLAICGALPRRFQRCVSQYIAAFEKRTGIAVLVVLGMLIYWGLRHAGWIGH